MKYIYITSLICLFYSLQAPAQEKLHYWGDSEGFLQGQATFIYEEAYRVLATHPPGITLSSERKLALTSLDALMHDTRLDNGSAFMTFMHQRYSHIAHELQNNKPVGREVRIFRLYNHGFIIQTASVTVAIDLVRGGRADNPFVDEVLMHPIVDQCDILFVTHAHGDHADPVVVKMFGEQGKQVIAPEDFWKNANYPLRIVRGTAMLKETIRLQAKNTSLTVHVYPGTQGDLLNNVYMITLPEGQTIMHTGDQDFSDDLATKAGALQIDVLLVQCWMLPMAPFVAGVQPALVITGHENEMLHTIDHREAYWLTFARIAEVKAPCVILAWGESYLITK